MDNSIQENDHDFDCLSYMFDNGYDYMITVDEDDCDQISLKCNQSADAFRLASYELLREIKKTPAGGGFLVPAWICLASFSCELYLKSLLLSYRYPDYDLPRVVGFNHHLEKLYKELEEEDKKAIRFETNRNGKQSFTEDEFHKHLETINSAFVKWRYSFEPKKTNEDATIKKIAINTIFLQAFQSAVFKVVEPFILVIGQTLDQYLKQGRVTDQDEIKKMNEEWKE